MSALLLALRLLVASVLGIAGVAKLRDRSGSAATLEGFGVPSAAVAPLALALPAAELAIGVGLIPTASARPAAVAALGLFVLFVVATVAALARGRRPECGCFGRHGSTSLGPATLLRAAALAAGAGWLVVAGPGLSTGSAAREPVGLLALAVALETLVLAVVLRRYGRVLARADAVAEHPAGAKLAPGAPAPAFTLAALSGDTVSTQTLRGKMHLLVFVSPSCPPCTALLPEVAAWQARHARTFATLVIAAGEAAAIRAHAEEHELDGRLVLVDEAAELARAFGANGTPACVLVDEHGVIAGSLSYGADGARALVAQAGERSPVPTHVEFELPRVGGGTLSSTELRGRRTLLLFWNPGCGYSRRIESELLAWEAERDPDEGAVVVVSYGLAEELYGIGFKAPVVLDDATALAARTGVTITPSVLLLDEEGRPASGVASGVDGVASYLGLERGETRSRAVRRGVAVAASATAAAVAAGDAHADDEDVAFRRMRRIVKTQTVPINSRAQRFAAAQKSLYTATDQRAAKFKVLAEIALLKQLLGRVGNEVDAIPVPDYRRGERGARIAKSALWSYYNALDRAVGSYAKVVNAPEGATARAAQTAAERAADDAWAKLKLVEGWLKCTGTNC